MRALCSLGVSLYVPDVVRAGRTFGVQTAMIDAHDVIPKCNRILILLSPLYVRNRSSSLAPKVPRVLVEKKISSAAFESQNAEIA
jgi:hypothetical protein